MTFPTSSLEKDLRIQGFKLIAGIDEVGRGAFAGPVVAAAVVFEITYSKLQIPNSIKINDSKKLSSKQRETSDRWIRENCLAYGVGTASVTQINKVGIKKATEIAFRKAIKNCGNVDFLLIDAFYIPRVKQLGRDRQKAIVKGDSLSISIAAASIVAKVYRDHLMTALSVKSKYKKYLWHKNKGYGTKAHRDIIQKHGISRLHRKRFVETSLKKA